MTISVTNFERQVLVDALRKAIRDPLAMETINETRKELVDRLKAA